MSGRVTRRGLSRWSDKGGSSRTIQRFFHASWNWCHLHWLLMRHHVLDADDVVLMSGEHVVVTKAGKMTDGGERFFSLLYGKTVSGRCCLRVSLLRGKRRTSYPVMTAQVDTPSDALVQAPPKKKASGRRGRPQGRKHHPRREVALRPALGFIQEPIKRWLEQIGAACTVVSCIFAGELGQNDAMQMVRQVGRHLVSKRRDNSARSLPSDGPYCGRGPRRKYGQKGDDRHLPSASLPSTAIAQEIKTHIDQRSLWQKKCAEMLTIVVIIKTPLHTHKTAHVVLFSSDLTLG